AAVTASPAAARGASARAGAEEPDEAAGSPAEAVTPAEAAAVAATAGAAPEGVAPPPAPALARAGAEPLELTPGRVLRFGTGRSNDVVLRQRGVGFKHAVVHVGADGTCEVEDLGGAGGVWVNGERVPDRGRVTLRPGDELRIGEESFQLTAPTAAVAPASPPTPAAPAAPPREAAAPVGASAVAAAA